VSSGVEPATSTPDDLGALIASELVLIRKVVKDANISL
jgi:hypothetical protein